MSKRVITVIITVFLITTLAGCNKGEETSSRTLVNVAASEMAYATSGGTQISAPVSTETTSEEDVPSEPEEPIVSSVEESSDPEISSSLEEPVSIPVSTASETESSSEDTPSSVPESSVESSEESSEIES